MQAPLIRMLACVALCWPWHTVHAAVRIEGLSDKLEANVRAHMRLDDEACDRDPAVIRYRFANAPAAIRAALRPFGHYEATIASDLQQPDGDCWEATFTVDPGPQVVFGDVRIEVRGEGASMPEFQAVVDSDTMARDQPLRHSAYEEAKNRLLTLAREFGFFDAKVESSVLAVDVPARRADVELVMDTGRRYRFGDLEINGDALDERFVRRYISFRTGAPYEQRRLRELHNDLVRADYFTGVELRNEPADDGTVNVIVNLQEGRRLRYGIAFGFGTDTGPVVRGDVVVRRINRRGHRVELDTELSRVRQSGTVDYRIPGKRPQRDWYSIYGGVNREDTDAVERVAWKTGVRLKRFHSRRWSSAPFTEVVIERFRQDNDWRQVVSVVPGWGVSYLWAADAVRPMRGIRLGAEVAGASKKLFSDASFARLLVSGKTILPISERGRVLIRGEAGWMTTSNFDEVPPTWRFFAGGDRSVRGYDYQALGPDDENGKSIGGRRLLTGSIEGDWLVREKWSGAVFVDAGNVGDDNLLRDLPWSVGVGARWYSPVGPIRLDLAFPQTGSNGFRIHISMGPDL